MSRWIPLHRAHRSRRCDVCGDPYHRRNLVEAWTDQAPGHRAGWTKAIIRVCTQCQPADETRRVALLAYKVAIVRRRDEGTERRAG